MTLTLLAAASLAAWVFLAFARGGFWRASERLEAEPDPINWPEVVAVIPARNEAESIAAVVASHMATDYPGAFSLILVDDASTDGTADLARSAAEGAKRPFEVLTAPPLEAGWTGKLAALNSGLSRAAETASHAKYVLLTDADIVHAPGTLRSLVAKAEADDLALASLMARLDSRGFWGKLLIPAFVYFFQKLYPFPVSNDPQSSLAAGAGGCMLVNRAALEASGGVAGVRDKLIDDCALAAQLKFKGGGAPRRTFIGLATDEVVSLRDNRPVSSVWHMVARTAFAQLNHSWLLLGGTLIGMAFVYLVPPLTALIFPIHRNALAGVLALAAWAMMTATFLPTARLYGLSAWRAALLPLSAFFYSLMTFSSALRHARGGGGLWKGRTYP